MSDSEKTPILSKPAESPIPPPTSDPPSQRASPSNTPPVSAPRIVDSGVIEGSNGYISRETYKFLFALFSTLFGLLNVGIWVSLSVTIYYLEGSSGYYGAVIGLASQMIAPTVQCASIASRITSIGYKHSARLGLKTLINMQLCFLAFQLLSSFACIGVSATYGIRYGKNGEDEINKDVNVAIGILNVSISSVIAIVTVVTLYIAVKLRKSLILADINSGPFATDGSFSQ